MLHNKIRVSIGLFVVLLLVSLVMHDSNLYPHLSTFETVKLSTLRLLLLLGSVLFAGLYSKDMYKKLQPLFLMGTFITLPYTAYSIFEIRHISEICRLSVGYYTDHCLYMSWTILPTFIYATVGLSMFFLSLYLIGKNKSIIEKYALTCFSIVYVSLSSIFGLYSRVNIWEIFTQPVDVFLAIIETMAYPYFWINSFALACTLTFLFFLFHQGAVFVNRK